MASRADRLKALSEAVAKYTSEEKTRIDNEVKALSDILKKRGASVQSVTTKIVEAVANNDLQAYLKGG